ncbi:MAG TPA: hypothetical protein VFL53_19285 [Pseudolabrys sp.]|nr:hypothetical protein [Pseudolabrys sp.]
MPIDLAQVDWLYVVLLAVFVAVSTFLGGLLSFSHRGAGVVLSALFFAVIFIFWTYYPHRVPFLPRTIATTQDAAKQTPPPAPAAPAPSQKPANPVRDITPPKNPVTDVTPPSSPATPAR